MLELHEGQFAISVHIGLLDDLLADLSYLFRCELIMGE
jgi:hypothetical protein